MDVKKEYYEFAEKYPSFAKDIISYEIAEGHAIKFKMNDGKIAWYYPIIANEGKRHSKKAK